MASEGLMGGKTCLITGANSGIGFATAREISRMGASVVLVCRDAQKGRAALEDIKGSTGNQSVELMIADLASFESVRALARDFLSTHQKLHVLINNAGVIIGKRILTKDGLETTLQVNYLSHFLLTQLLLEAIKSSTPARIVNVTSDAHFTGKMDFDDLQEERGYGAMKSYSQSKLAQVLFTHELAKKLQGSGVTVNCVHPGAVRTRWGDEAGTLAIGIKIARPFLLSPEKGAETPIYVATSPDIQGVSGKYYAKKTVRESSKESYSEDEAQRLWELSLKLCGLPNA
jgi:NAD(P)-dependent dehydrogenase (short-subunit alcohol dehydrogenase family)